MVTPDLEAIQDNAQLKVDLRKAQEACEKLSSQLTESEAAREQLEKAAEENTEEATVARKAREMTLQVKKDKCGKASSIKKNAFCKFAKCFAVPNRTRPT